MSKERYKITLKACHDETKIKIKLTQEEYLLKRNPESHGGAWSRLPKLSLKPTPTGYERPPNTAKQRESAIQ